MHALFLNVKRLGTGTESVGRSLPCSRAKGLQSRFFPGNAGILPAPGSAGFQPSRGRLEACGPSSCAPVGACRKRPLCYNDVGRFEEGKRMVSGLIGNEVPFTGLRVRLPCPPLTGLASIYFSSARRIPYPKNNRIGYSSIGIGIGKPRDWRPISSGSNVP